MKNFRWQQKLIKANVSKNIVLLDEVIEDLSNIRWGFQKAIEIQTGVSTVESVMQERNERMNEGGNDAG